MAAAAYDQDTLWEFCQGRMPSKTLEDEGSQAVLFTGVPIMLGLLICGATGGTQSTQAC